MKDGKRRKGERDKTQKTEGRNKRKGKEKRHSRRTRMKRGREREREGMKDKRIKDRQTVWRMNS